VRRRSTPFDWLVVGLGNPGKEYARTRHNVGEDVVVELARRRGDMLRGGRDNSLVAESRIGDERWVLAFPLTYMNESGMAVRSLVRRYGIEDAAHLIVVHDELDCAASASISARGTSCAFESASASRQVARSAAATTSCPVCPLVSASSSTSPCRRPPTPSS